LKTAILGGGLTGLTVGYLLNQKKQEYEIFEKNNECGGLMRSLNEQGYTFDYGGSHIIFSRKPELTDFMIKLLGNNKIKNRRNTKILYKGTYVKYPFENGLSNLSKEENLECLYEFVQCLLKKAKNELEKPENMHDWFFYTFGKGIAEKYLIPYNEKIWKFPTKKIGLDWVERIPDPPVEDIMKSSLGIETEGYTHQLYFHYPKEGGIEAIIKTLEEKCSNNLSKNFEVQKIKPEGKKWIISDGKQEKSTDRIVSTIPLQYLTEAIEVPSKVKAAVADLKYNSLISVMIGVNRDRLNDLSWLYIPDKKVLTHRVSFPSNFSPNAAPTMKSSILAEITCTEDNEIWMKKDDEIINQTIDDLSSLKLLKKNDVCFTRVKKSKFAYVITDKAYNENLKIIKQFFIEKGIFLAGRFSEYKYLNMDECIQSALNLAKHLTA
jgi:protoporphyrinogen oxidase